MISVVTTVYNEADLIAEFYKRVTAVFSKLKKDYEIVFVDDGSTDSSGSILKEIAFKDKHVKVAILSRNFGQHAAIAAGFKIASGDPLIWMDADLQDIPEEIPKLLSKSEEGYDIVYGTRKNRAGPFYRKASARLIFFVFEKLSGHRLPKGLSTFRLMRRRVVEEFNKMTEHSRFTAGMMAWLGFSSATVEIDHAERQKGKSKYSFLKLITLSFDSIISFSDYPLKLASQVGFLLSLAAFITGAYMIFRKLTVGFIISGYASLIVSLFFLAGLQILFLGIIGEYITRIFRDVQGRPIYIVKEKVNI